MRGFEAMDKPHKGSIKNWSKIETDNGLGFYIKGIFVDHPSLTDGYSQTSWVVAQDGNEIETRNSRYTLIGEEAGAGVAGEASQEEVAPRPTPFPLRHSRS